MRLECRQLQNELLPPGAGGQGPAHHCFFYIASNEKLGGTHESLEVKHANQQYMVN